jgi:hypothetical protein
VSLSSQPADLGCAKSLVSLAAISPVIHVSPILTRVDSSVFSKGTFPEVSAMHLNPLHNPNGGGGVPFSLALSQTASAFSPPTPMTTLPIRGVLSPHRHGQNMPFSKLTWRAGLRPYRFRELRCRCRG